MASFMGLFRRWLEPSDEDNNNQRQPTPSDESNEDKRRSEMVSSFQRETERQQKEFQSAIERLEAELKSAKEETIAQQRQHTDALATKESECQRLSRELRRQIDTLNNRWMTERRKSEQLEKTMEDQKMRQQQELQMQQESNARQLKELQDTIGKHDRITKNERTENLRLRNEYQRTLDAKEADGYRLNQQLIEVSGRLEDEVKVSVAEKKRWEMAEAILESQTEKMKQLDVQHKDTVRQLNVVNESLAKQTKEQTEERKKLDSVEKQYKETLAQKESDFEKLQGRLVAMKSNMQHQTKEMNSERRKNKILEKEIKENKERVLQLTNQHQQQVNRLQGTVDQLTKELENERRMMTEVEKERDQALVSNEINRQKLQKDLTNLNNRFESRSRALQEEKQTRQTFQIQLQEQKKIECQKDRALEMEKKAKEVLQQQLQEQKEIECQKERSLEMEKKAKEVLQQQLQEQKEIECKKDRALEMEKKAKEVLQLHLQEQKRIECQKDRSLEMEKKAKEVLQQQLQEQKKIECQKDRALEMEKKAKEVLQQQLQERKEIECQKDRASEMEKKAMEVLQQHLQELKEIECQKDRALEMEKKAKEVLQLQLREKKKAECEKDDQLQKGVKQLSDYGVEILFLTKELETQRQKNVLLEKDHHELFRRANDDCESLRATVAELQIRLENQAKNLLMERRKGDELEKQFQWQTEVLKHQECQLGTTRKELDELKELFSHREIELSNERLQNAYVDIDHRTLIAVKDQECKEFGRQLTETRERLESQTQLLAIEREKRESVSKELEDQKKRQLETEERQKKQLRDLEERLKTLQTPGTKEDEEDIEGGRETSTTAGRDESTPKGTSQSSNREDTVLESQKLSKQLSVIQEKLERATEELARERQTRLDIQEQTKQLMAERDALMEKTAEEQEKLTSRITELEIEKRSRIQKSDNQNNQPFKRDETQSKESIKTKPDDMNTNQVIGQEDSETIPVRSVDSETKQSEQVIPKATQLDEQMKRISELSEALDEEKQKNLKLTIQRRHIRSKRDRPKIKHQLEFVQQKISKEQMPLEHKKQGMEPPTRVDENRRETESTDSQEKVQADNQANWTLENNIRKATIHAKAAAREDCTTSNRLNPLRLDESKVQELRERMKILQPLRAKAVTHPGTLNNQSQPQKQQQHILTKIKEEPMEKKYEDNETEVDILPDAEDPPLPTKRRRLEESISTDASYYSAPYDQLAKGGVRVIEIKPEPNIKREPIEEQIARTPIITDSKDRSNEPGPVTKQEPKEERGPRIKQEPLKEPVVVNSKRLRDPSTYRSIPKKPGEHTATDSKTNTTTTKNIESNAPEESVVHSSPEEARLVQTLRPQSLTTPVTGVTVLNGCLFVVSEMNSVVEVYDSTTFTFNGKVSVEDLTNPQSLTSCPLNDCLYILNRAQPSNAIYRLGLAPNWHHNKWSIGTDFGALASTSTGSLLLSCFDLKIKEFSSTGKLIRQFPFGQSASHLRLFGAVQLHRTSRTPETSTEAQFAISYSHRRTGLRRVCTVDGNGRVVNPLLKYNGSCTSQHLIVGRQTGALFLADFGMGEVFQWNAELKNCRTIRRKKDPGFRPLRICLDQNEKRIIIAEVSLSNDGSTSSGKSKLSIYDL